MQMDEDRALPVRYVEWRLGDAVGVVFRPDVPLLERLRVCASWSAALAAEQPQPQIPIPIQRQPEPLVI